MIHIIFSIIKRIFLRFFSYFNFDIKENYLFVRKLVDRTSRSFFPIGYRKWDYRVVRGGHEIPVRIFESTRTHSDKLLIHFHGGGWVTGNIDSYKSACANLAKHTKTIVAAVDYRLAPEHKFPVGLEDCYFATLEIMRHARQLGISTRNITLIGDSAGGNLAAVVSMMLRDRNNIRLNRQILIYPSTHYEHDPEKSPFDSIREKSVGFILTSKQICDYIDLYKSCDEDLHNPYFAPLLSEDLSHLPNSLVITAENDPLRDEGMAYARRLRKAGNNVHYVCMKGALHGFFTLPPSAEKHLIKCYKLIKEFIR